MKTDEKLREKLVGIAASMQDDEGLELIDPQSKYVEIGPRRLSLAEQIKRVLHKEVQRYVEHAEMESAEDADDFDVPDEDPLPLSGFEHTELQEDVIAQPLDDAVEAADLELQEEVPATQIDQPTDTPEVPPAE